MSKAKHPLQHLIPSPDFLDTYISREFDGFVDLDIIEYAHTSLKNLLIFGPTGPGKTSMLFAYASKMQIPIATIQCNGGADIAAVFGGPVMTEDRRIEYVESDVIQVIRHGGILYFDELNFLPARHTANFHALFDFRRTIVLQDKQNEHVEASPDLLVVGSFNPGYEGTRPLNEALANRFQIKLHCDYDNAIEKQLVSSEVLLNIAGMIRARTGRDIFTPCSTNMLIEFVEQCEDISLQFAIMNFTNSFREEERSSIREMFAINRAELEAQFGDDE